MPVTIQIHPLWNTCWSRKPVQSRVAPHQLSRPALLAWAEKSPRRSWLFRNQLRW